MSVQPQDRALLRDHVPALEDASLVSSRRFRRFLYFFVRQHRLATHNTWSVLDRIRDGGATPALPLQPVAVSATQPLWRQVAIPPRWYGHLALLMLVLAAIMLRGLPNLALGMDWTQGATLATDHVAGPLDFEDLAGVQPPLVLEAPATRAAPTIAEVQDALQPLEQARPVAVSSAFVTTHVVAPGETLGQIAARYGVSALSLLMANEMRGGMLAIGQELRIPSVSGRPHVVAEGETVESIAQRYGVPTTTIRFFPANRLDSGRQPVPGEEIFIPGAEAVAGAPSESEAAAMGALPIGTVRDDETNVRSGPGTAYEKVGQLSSRTALALLGQHDGWYKVRGPDNLIGWISADLLIVADGVKQYVSTDVEVPPLPTPVPTAAPKPIEIAKPAAPAQAAKPQTPQRRVAGRWVWPAAGDLTSGFGYRSMRVGRFHNGIDIANRRGTPIRAARGGTVIAAGWCGGYGYCVKINHGDGFVTEYGHMAAQPSVRVGQWVDAGQYLGPMGMTYGAGGYASGVHLHFTVKLNGVAVNPLRYLP